MAAKQKKPRKKITTMRLPPDLMARIKAEAAREGRSQANLVEKVLRDALKKREARKKELEGEGADVGSVFS